MKKHTTGIAALTTSAAIYGSYGIIIHVLATELPANSQIVFRYTLSLIFFSLLIAGLKVKIRVPRTQIPLLTLFGLLMQVAIWCFTQSALLISIPSLLGYFYIGSIVSSTLLGFFFFGERIGIRAWFGTFLALLGLYALVGNESSLMGVVYGMIAGSVESLTYGVRKKLTTSKGLLTLAAILGVLGFTSISLLFSSERLLIPSQASTWIAGVVFAILTTIVNVAMTYGFRTTSVNLGSVIMSGEIVFGTLLSYFLLRAVPTQQEVVAALLIILSIVWQNVRMKQNAPLVVGIRKLLES